MDKERAQVGVRWAKENIRIKDIHSALDEYDGDRNVLGNVLTVNDTWIYYETP